MNEIWHEVMVSMIAGALIAFIMCCLNRRFPEFLIHYSVIGIAGGCAGLAIKFVSAGIYDTGSYGALIFGLIGAVGFIERFAEATLSE